MIVLTPTRDREVALGYLARLIGEQTIRPEYWVIATGEPLLEHDAESLERVADCPVQIVDTHQEPTLPVLLSLADNVRRGLEWIRETLDASDDHLYIAVMEDDDWYAPGYLEQVEAQLDDAPLVGNAPSIYYDVRNRRWLNCQNCTHASLCATAWDDTVVGDHLDTVLIRTMRQGGAFFDVALWREWEGRSILGSMPSHLGVKNLPGAKGIGVGHRNLLPNEDPHGDFLADWVGTEWAAVYARHYRHHSRMRHFPR